MRVFPLSLALAVILTACSTGGRDGPAPLRAGSGGELLYAQGQYLAYEGDYIQSLRAYSCAAEYGPGYEVAWHAAGLMALQLAGMPETPEDRRDALTAIGYDALDTAARTGWAASQAELALRYHDAGREQEAANWAAIYRTNTRDDSLGLERLPDETFLEIRNAADYPAALTRAADFFPRPLARGEPGPECHELMRPVDSRRSRGFGVSPDVGSSRPQRSEPPRPGDINGDGIPDY